MSLVPTVIVFASLFGDITPDPFNIKVVVMEDNTLGHLPFGYNRSMAAVNIAEEKVREMYRGYINFTFIYRTTICGGEGTGALAADLHCENTIGAFIGPGCTTALKNLGQLAKSWNIPVVTPVGSGISNPDDYPQMTKMSPHSTTSYVSAIVTVLKHYKWYDVGIIYDEAYTVSVMMKDGLIGVFGKTLQFRHTTYQYSGDAYTDDELRRMWQEASQRARVFIVLCRDHDSRALMLHAHDLGYTNSGECVFFIMENLSEWPGEFHWRIGDDNDEMFLKALGHAFWPYVDRYKTEDTNFTAELVRRSLLDYGFDYAGTEPGKVVSGYYDSVLMYAQVLNETLAEGGDPLDGLAITQKLWNNTFEGIHVPVTLNEKGFRQSVVTFGIFSLETGRRTAGLMYDYKLQEVSLPSGPIPWPYSQTAGAPPPNQPRCGFKNDQCSPDSDSTTLIATMSGLLGCFAVAGSIAGVLLSRTWKKQYERDLWWWKINSTDLTMTRRATASVLSLKASKNSLRNGLTFEPSIASDILTDSDFAIWKGQLVCLRRVPLKQVNLTRSVLVEFKMLRDVNNTNLVRIFGACLEDDLKALVTEHCVKGSLQDLLGNCDVTLDVQFKFSLCTDIVNGLCYIHASPIRYHGRLRSAVCFIDNRFSLKLSDFGLPTLYSNFLVDTTKQEYKNECMWKAPELLRSGHNYTGSKEGDIYSCAIILHEIVTRNSPFAVESVYLTTDEIIQKVQAGTSPPFRPSNELPLELTDMKALIDQCWAEDPKQRPLCPAVRSSIKRIASSHGETGNLMDNLMRRMEMYANNLEKMVEEKTEELREEKKRSEELLYQILPRSVADRLRSGLRVEPQAYECVTIYFSDVVGFTHLSARSSPMEVVDLLNDLYSSFDSIIEEFDVYKVETIGDGYMVASGLPQINGNLHSMYIARMSIKVLETIREFRVRHLPNENVKIRIGVHSGPVCAGVVGLKMPRYCLFGDTVNTASRMESNGKEMRIHISPTTKALLDQFEIFTVQPRGRINIKGKGDMFTYWLMPPGNSTDYPTK